MEQVPLLSTKLHIPPTRTEQLRRPQLIQRLNGGLDRKLTLLSAPAGSGKTTLLCEWVSQLQVPVAWLSLEPEDDEVVRFWSYALAALQNVLGDQVEQGRQTLQAPQLPAVSAYLTPLLNVLSSHSERTVLVLDDYHFISDRAIHDGISFLLEHLPRRFHLVIATRADPPLSIVRLRARGQLTEIRVDDLRFSVEEARTLLNERMELGLHPEDVLALATRTEGWIVGLQLAGLALRGVIEKQGPTDARELVAAFTGSHHFILEYLSEEVLLQQPELVQRFLVNTSILDRLCGSLCDALTATSEGEAMLEQLHRDNLFVVPLDDEHRWYRYHPLFANVLRKRLGKDLPEEQSSALYRAASVWHEDNGTLGEAVKYALRIHDYERVVELVEREAREGGLGSRLTTMLRWLDAVPDALLMQRPRLRIYQAWALVINEQVDRAREILGEASEALRSLPPPSEQDPMRDDLATLLAIVEMMASALASAYSGEDLEGVYQRALVARKKALTAQNVFLASHAANGLAMARYYQGRLGEAAEYYRQLAALGPVGEVSHAPLVAVGCIGLAAIHLERNELETAATLINEGLRLAEYRVGANTLVSAAITRSRLRQASGNVKGALEALDEVAQAYPVQRSKQAMHRLTRQRAWLRLSEGNVDEAAYLVQQLADLSTMPVLSGTSPASFREAESILRARIALACGRSQEALEVLEPIYEDARAADRLGRVLEVCILKAMAWRSLGDVAAARQSLRESLALAEPEGYVRIYLEEGPRLLQVLALLDREPLPEPRLQRYAEKLKDALETATPSRRRDPGEPLAGLVEPLTKRELQVLRLMSAELSSPEIAEELVIAVSTARSHIKSIYRKLDAHSRYEAVERARQLQLL